MKFIAKLIFLVGVGSLAMDYFEFGKEYTRLSWMNHWGDETSWTIRVTLAIFGGLLYFTCVWIDAGSKERRLTDSR